MRHPSPRVERGWGRGNNEYLLLKKIFSTADKFRILFIIIASNN